MNLADQTTIRCRTCIHWIPNGAEAMAVRADIGECRRNPPVLNYTWPRTRPDQHCGQHELRKAPLSAKRTNAKRPDADGSLLNEATS